MLSELIARLRSGEIDLDEFARLGAAEFRWRKVTPYPDIDHNDGTRTAVSSVTLSNAVFDGELTKEEAAAVYAALPPQDA